MYCRRNFDKSNNYCLDNDLDIDSNLDDRLEDGTRVCPYMCSVMKENNSDNQYFEKGCSQYNNWNEIKDDCMCGFDEIVDNTFPENPMFGQSYVPIQIMTNTFKPQVGIKMGTLFPELVSPYEPCQSIMFNDFIKLKNEIGEGCNK